MPKKIIMIFFFVFSSTISWAFQPKIYKDCFTFNPAKMDIGNVYHYIASDTHGKSPINVYVFIKSPKNIVIYRDYSSIYPNIALIQSVNFNWEYMMADYIIASNPLDIENELTYRGSEQRVDIKKKSITTLEDQYGESGVAIAHYQYEPCFNYEIYHIDLQFALRFLKKNYKHFDCESYIGNRVTEETVKFQGFEKINGVICRKYEMKAKGILATLTNMKSYFWIAKNDFREYTVKYVNYVPRATVWATFQLKLVDIKKMSLTDWEQFVQRLIAQGNKKITHN